MKFHVSAVAWERKELRLKQTQQSCLIISSMVKLHAEKARAAHPIPEGKER